MTDVSIDELRANAVKISDNQPTVTIGDDPLPVGQHRIQLVVTDDSGNHSAPAQVEVIVEPAPTRPVPAPADPPRSGGGGHQPSSSGPGG